MKAILLAGGYGTRLNPLSYRTPKCLMPIAGKANILHLIEMLKKADVNEIILSLNTTQMKVKEFLGDGKKFGVNIKYIFEKSTCDKDKLGAIGALQYVIRSFGIKEEILVVGADNFIYGLDASNFREFHKRNKGIVTIALYNLADKTKVEQFGIASINEKTGRILKFQEKPKVEEAISRLASTLFYQINEKFFDKYLPIYISEKEKKGEKPDKIGDLWQYFVNKIPVFGYVFEGIWGDVGNAETYINVNKEVMNFLKRDISNKANISENAFISGNGVVIGENVVIEEGAKIKGPVIIERNCTIKKNAIIGPYTYILHDSYIGSKSLITGSIIFENVKIGERVRCEDCIIDGFSEIGNDSIIESYSIIGYKAKLNDGCRIFTKSKIWPYMYLEKDGITEGEIIFPEILNTHLGKELEESKYW